MSKQTVTICSNNECEKVLELNHEPITNEADRLKATHLLCHGNAEARFITCDDCKKEDQA